MGLETLLLVGVGLSAAGTAYNAYQDYKAGKADEKLANEQARLESEAAAAEAGNIREKGRRLLASQRASLAGAGVKIDEGSGDALQKETTRLTEQDALAVLKEGANRASLLRQQGKAAGQAATASLVSGALDVGSTVVSAANKYNRAKAPAATAAKFRSDAEALNFATRNAPKYSLLNSSYAKP